MFIFQSGAFYFIFLKKRNIPKKSLRDKLVIFYFMSIDLSSREKLPLLTNVSTIHFNPHEVPFFFETILLKYLKIVV